MYQAIIIAYNNLNYEFDKINYTDKSIQERAQAIFELMFDLCFQAIENKYYVQC